MEQLAGFKPQFMIVQAKCSKPLTSTPHRLFIDFCSGHKNLNVYFFHFSLFTKR